MGLVLDVDDAVLAESTHGAEQNLAPAGNELIATRSMVALRESGVINTGSWRTEGRGYETDIANRMKVQQSTYWGPGTI